MTMSIGLFLILILLTCNKAQLEYLTVILKNERCVSITTYLIF